MAARTHAMDTVLSAARWRAGIRTTYGFGEARLRRAWRRTDVLHAAAARGDGDHRTGGGEAVALLGDHRRRRVSRSARLRSNRQGGHLHRLERSAHASRPRLAAR